MAKELENASNPMVIVSSHALEREDGDALLSTVHDICDKYGVIDPEA